MNHYRPAIQQALGVMSQYAIIQKKDQVGQCPNKDASLALGSLVPTLFFSAHGPSLTRVGVCTSIEKQWQMYERIALTIDSRHRSQL